jgi:hypothetical protein
VLKAALGEALKEVESLEGRVTHSPQEAPARGI